MITENKKSKHIAHEGRKMYYLVMDSNNPVGVCTQMDIALSYLADLAAKKNAVQIATGVYKYSTVTGTHIMDIQEVIRIKG